MSQHKKWKSSNMMNMSLAWFNHALCGFIYLKHHHTMKVHNYDFQSKLILKACVYCWFETTSHYAGLELISFYHSLLSSPFRSLLTCLFRVLFCFCSFAFWEEKLHCSVLNSQKSDTGTLPPTQSLDADWLFGSWRIEGMYFSVSLFPNDLVPDTVSVLRK